MAKQRQHNEWFRTVSLGGRKSCPTCGAKLNGEPIWSWGEYVRAKWRTVKHFCKECAAKEVLQPLAAHADGCGCVVNLTSNCDRLPEWLVLPTKEVCQVS